jgi:hypothetical protein
VKDLQGFRVFPLGGEVDVGLDITSCRAGECARGATVSHVVRKEEFQPELACLADPVCVGPDDHVGGNGGGAGSRKRPRALDVHEADGAASVERKMRIVTKCGNFDTALRAEIQKTLSRLSVDVASVEDDFYSSFAHDCTNLLIPR